MAKKQAAPEPAGESAPMWIVSFADLVTLMMSFFVVLYALKQGGPQQQLEAAAAIKATFDYIPPENSDSPLDQAVRRRLGMPLLNKDSGHGQSADPAQGAEGAHPQVETLRAGRDIVTGAKILFAVGQSNLTPASLKIIDQIAQQVRGHNNVLMIKGNVSADEAAMRPDDPNGMALSYRRANAVADALVKRGIDRRVLRPVACGPFEPIKTGVYDTAGLEQNRRVEVFTTDYAESDYFPQSTVPAIPHEDPATAPSTP